MHGLNLASDPSLADLPLTRTKSELRLRGFKKFQIVSMWDMTKFHADVFVEIARKIGGLHGWLSAELFKNKANTNWGSGFIKQTKESLDAIEFVCQQEGLDMVLAQCQRTRSILETRLTIENITGAVEQITIRLEDELRTKLFLSLTGAEARLYTDAIPFGQDVADMFPGASSDIEEAAKCLALSRFTACVFHCMRGVEDSLDKFMLKLLPTLNPSGAPNWGDKLRKINDELVRRQRLPNSDPNQKTYEEFHAHIKAMKNVWRDTTMHLEKTYTEEQANKIYRHVKDFMISLIPVLR